MPCKHLKKTLLALMALAGVASSAEYTTILSWSDILSSVSIPSSGVTKSNLYEGDVYRFDGTSSMKNGSSEALNSALSASSGYVTIAAWINPDSYTEAQYGDYGGIFSWGEAQKGFVFDLKNDDLNLTTKYVMENTFTESGVPSGTNTWTLVAVTIDIANKKARAFQGSTSWDDTSIGNNDGTVLWNTPTNQVFAIGSQNGNADTKCFEGLIGGVSVLTSDAYLTAEQIKTAMGNAPMAIPEPTTATLSLLALAGLAARRRRR